MVKIKKIIKYGASGALGCCFLAWVVHGGIVLSSNEWDYAQIRNEKRFPILKEIKYINHVSNEYSGIISEETKEKFKLEEGKLRTKLSDLEKELLLTKVKCVKTIKRAINPLTYLMD